MRIAFIDHSFHQKTGSSGFFIEILGGLGTVDLLLDENWRNGGSPWLTTFDPGLYDLVVVWQAHEALRHLPGDRGNIVFVPMYDAMEWQGRFFWRQEFARARVLSFSWRLSEEMRRLGMEHRTVQYYPDPDTFNPVQHGPTPVGFFWERTPALPEEKVIGLARAGGLKRLTIHGARSPHGAVFDAAHQIEITRTGWFDSRQSFLDVLGRHSVFFASRPLEGIGMGFLEAMAMGQCVVAPNAPTMNEYIANGTTGLLYGPGGWRSSFDLSHAADMGARARESVAKGHARWQEGLPATLDFVAGTAKAPVRRRSTGSLTPRAAVGSPRLSVITVCRNAANLIAGTIESVLSQDFPGVEYVIVDGASDDGTLAVVDRYGDRITRVPSEPDGGPFHAMNRALGHVNGEYVLFMNAGDSFMGSDALSRLFANLPDGTDVVFGHHLHRSGDGVDRLRLAADFELTWRRLKRGDVFDDWLSGIPCHQSTAVRTELLRRLGLDTRYRIAADLDLLFRARAAGARFHNADELVAIYVQGGLSSRNRKLCESEWRVIATTHSDTIPAEWPHAELHGRRLTRLSTAVLRTVNDLLDVLGRIAERPGLLGRGTGAILRSPVTKALWRIVRPLLR